MPQKLSVALPVNSAVSTGISLRLKWDRTHTVPHLSTNALLWTSPLRQQWHWTTQVGLTLLRHPAITLPHWWSSRLPQDGNITCSYLQCPKLNCQDKVQVGQECCLRCANRTSNAPIFESKLRGWPRSSKKNSRKKKGNYRRRNSG